MEGEQGAVAEVDEAGEERVVGWGGGVLAEERAGEDGSSYDHRGVIVVEDHNI